MEKIYKIEEGKLLFTLTKLAEAYVFGLLKNCHDNCQINCTIIPPLGGDEWELCIWAMPKGENNNAEEVARELTKRTCRFIGTATSDIRIVVDKTGLAEARVKFEF